MLANLTNDNDTLISDVEAEAGSGSGKNKMTGCASKTKAVKKLLEAEVIKI